jgi:hypothetical protein
MHPDGRPLDTTPEAWERYLEAIRRMTPNEKLQRVFELTDSVRSMAEAGVRARYPNASEREIFLRTGATWLGRELMIKAYGWDPESDAPVPDSP